VPSGRMLFIVLRVIDITYMTPANRTLEPRARNAAKLRTPSRTNAPTVSVNAAISTEKPTALPGRIFNIIHFKETEDVITLSTEHHSVIVILPLLSL